MCLIIIMSLQVNVNYVLQALRLYTMHTIGCLCTFVVIVIV